MLNHSFVESGIARSVFFPPHQDLVGEHPKIQAVRRQIHRFASTELMVLVTGETGTGKDIAANLLHSLSSRRARPFIKINCPSIPEGMIESILFGHERGAFTGAHTLLRGRLERADGGTVFLDELLGASSLFQSKLSHFLDGESFMRVGGTLPVHVNVRVVAAANMRVEDAVLSGQLREDIAFRLGEVVIVMPPLRDRLSDLPLLVEHFNFNACRALQKEYQPLRNEYVEELKKQEWPGNVRQLSSRVKEYVATGDLEALLEDRDSALPEMPSLGMDDELTPPNPALGIDAFSFQKGLTLKEAAQRAAEQAEKFMIREALRITRWNRREAAKLLGTSYSSLLRRIDAYGVGRKNGDINAATELMGCERD